MDQPERLLTRQEVAEMLAVPVKTLAEWATRGRGPRYYVVGKHARYRAGDVQTWLRSRERVPQAG